ncbi:unnamed protein product [Prunus brigantina]
MSPSTCSLSSLLPKQLFNFFTLPPNFFRLPHFFSNSLLFLSIPSPIFFGQN